ncbi:hypothetical protein [Enterococcus ratti]|uniref:Uncharacterized protein n=1 Tax=Enterococcus ratti TaxID=150033 RepID=A0A1L8WLN7_9ENTE|nr:hypothetical protein [Enterococcus ratti]OJG81702.1 hypothetical protein RV14_GL000229 [Enterococcus ratti]
MEKEPYQKIDEITTKVNTYVEKLEGILGQIEKTLHSPIKLTDDKTSSIQQLDDNIKELESLEKDIQKDSKKVDKLNKACQIKEKKISSINRSPFKRVISLFTGEKNSRRNKDNSLSWIFLIKFQKMERNTSEVKACYVQAYVRKSKQ